MDKTYDQHSMEELRTEYSGSFPQELPARPGPRPKAPWRLRLRSFLTFSPSSFNFIHTPDGAVRLRHIAMITILVLRTAGSALSIISAVVKKSVAGIIIYSLLAVLSLWFTATCLAIIGDAAGDKSVKLAVLKHWHLDAFLGFCVVVHAVFIIVFFFGLSGWGLEVASVAMWFAILGVAWIAGWQPELSTYQRTWVT
ncbi:MAG: hypothetical protein M1820_000504 [Bogoriella megaspora]|nr:MAG: hypothetical protein M1820_000504 [Bogoriella megaspora]